MRNGYNLSQIVSNIAGSVSLSMEIKQASSSLLKVYDKEILFHHPSLSLWLNSLLEVLTDYFNKILPWGTVTREASVTSPFLSPYLGSPLYKGNKKCILYDDLIAKMRLKLQGWGQSSLSHGGRLALIRSTLCSMSLHLIQVLNPPKTVLHSIEQIMARFFWGSTENHKKFTGQLGSEYVYQSRKEDWVSEDSLMWWLRSLTNFGGDLEAGVHYGQARTGRECVVFELKFKGISFGSLGQVKSHFGAITGSVSNHFLNWFTLHSLAQKNEDLIKWKLTHHGQFSTSSAWEYIRQQKNTHPIMKDVWNPCLIPTISVFAWRVLQIGYQLIPYSA
ncbi:UNVERIFIED_CONTAM: hypothetical protein Sangu_2412200 [Sesamum angustifolium]|uniref:Reverse transcriptase zinc-binding domain-containing protein n=1 Tax=Sesamum angustifolium TaxID=2727405 RepID=A0AAW2KVX5_9LAMI